MSGPLRKPTRLDTVVFPWWHALRGFRGARFLWVCVRSRRGTFCRKDEYVGQAADENRPSTISDLPGKLEGLVEPLTRGDPISPLRWTCKSTRRLSQELTKLGYSASSRLVGVLLHEMGYSLQGNRQTIEGKLHPDRNAQFEYINARVTAQMRAAQPVISVDTKKKELIGN